MKIRNLLNSPLVIDDRRLKEKLVFGVGEVKDVLDSIGDIDIVKQCLVGRVIEEVKEEEKILVKKIKSEKGERSEKNDSSSN